LAVALLANSTSSGKPTSLCHITNYNSRQATDTAMVDVNTAQVLASDAQQALFREWAEGTEFELKINASPKQQFNVLAKLLHWVGGEEPWNAHWKECFGEEYIWRAGSSMYPIDFGMFLY
jgi:hypothetical protein